LRATCGDSANPKPTEGLDADSHGFEMAMFVAAAVLGALGRQVVVVAAAAGGDGVCPPIAERK